MRYSKLPPMLCKKKGDGKLSPQFSNVFPIFTCGHTPTNNQIPLSVLGGIHINAGFPISLNTSHRTNIFPIFLDGTIDPKHRNTFPLFTRAHQPLSGTLPIYVQNIVEMNDGFDIVTDGVGKEVGDFPIFIFGPIIRINKTLPITVLSETKEVVLCTPKIIVEIDGQNMIINRESQLDISLMRAGECDSKITTNIEREVCN